MSKLVSSRFLDSFGIESSELKAFRARFNTIKAELDTTEETLEETVNNSSQINEALVQAKEKVKILDSFVTELGICFAEAFKLVTLRKTTDRERKFDVICDEVLSKINILLNREQAKFSFKREDLFENIYQHGPNYRLIMLHVR